jgi:cyclic dehypoxanthinyl futalosine synthase
MREAHGLGCARRRRWCSASASSRATSSATSSGLRALQDETAGFTAFICWPFQAEGTRLKLRDDTTAMRYLRVFALARLYLDNFPSLQVSWPTMGPEVGQVALRFGGNDFGSAMIEENVVSQAGAIFKLGADDIERYIRAAGFTPRRRNMRYERLAVA